MSDNGLHWRSSADGKLTSAYPPDLDVPSDLSPGFPPGLIIAFIQIVFIVMAQFAVDDQWRDWTFLNVKSNDPYRFYGEIGSVAGTGVFALQFIGLAVNKQFDDWISNAALWACIAVVGGVLLWTELQAGYVVQNGRLTVTPANLFEKSKSWRIDQATEVKIGCLGHHSRGGISYTPMYKVEFADGSEFDLGLGVNKSNILSWIDAVSDLKLDPTIVHLQSNVIPTYSSSYNVGTVTDYAACVNYYTNLAGGPRAAEFQSLAGVPLSTAGAS